MDKVVYDSIEPSPYYLPKVDKVPYLAERDYVNVT